ncbi:MAG: hypothetical protein HKM24_04010, partial [Gammaproteobacteria bacterium]|nr:hypothetical protein [Gammaproteobacteria bacterium]
GAESWLVHSLAGLFVVARVWHAWDFSRNPDVSNGRTWGTMLTWMIITALCVGNIWYSIQLSL